MKKQKKFKTLLILLIVAGTSLLLIPELRASFTQTTIGWIWGGMDQTGGGNTGLGWISLNSRDCDTDGNGTVSASEQAATPGCPAGAIIDYGLNVPPVGNGLVTGYGWSENYGWISFNDADIAGCPDGNCTVRRVGNDITGWARILSIRDAGVNAGGWSGWINLNDTANGYKVTMPTATTFSGYAYSDEIGWIDFSNARISLPITFKVCQETCNSGKQLSAAVPLNILDTNPPVTVVACYSTAFACDDAVNPAVAAVWTKTSNGAITMTSSNPDILVPVIQTGPGSKTDTVTATFSGQNVSFDVIVTKFCDQTCPPASNAAVCSGSTFSLTSVTPGCGSVNYTCNGTRSCNYNWKEIAP